jgi:hypothetical protein
LTAPIFTLGVFVVFGLVALLVVVLFPVKVYRHGLRCYDVAGRYHTIRWEQIKSADEVSILGLPYLSVKGDGLRQPLTVPLWLKDMPGFRRETERLAGRGNVLVRALETSAGPP